MRHFIILAATFIIQSLHAQSYQFELSAVAGPGFARIWGMPAKNELKEQKNLVSFYTGIGLQFNAPNFFTICTGVFVERKGFVLPLKGIDKNGN